MFSFSSIEEYHAALKNRATTCEQAVLFYLDRINKNSSLNAFIRIYYKEALEKARELDTSRAAGKPVGKLHGVIIGIKDVICFKDHPVTASSGILQNFISLYNSTVVQKLLDEDAIIIGHLNCDEFAMGSTNEFSYYGKVLNPLDQTRVPGGSSGGSAAALAAGLCMISFGSDTGGSVRQPASFCGIVGLKPTYGRVSRHGLIAYASSFDQIGIFGKNLKDVALVLEVISGPDEYDSTAETASIDVYHNLNNYDKNFRIAYFPQMLDHPSLDPEIKKRLYSLIGELKKKGTKVEPVDFDMLDYIVPAYYILTTAEASSNLSRYDGVRYGYRSPKKATFSEFFKKTRSESFGKEVKRRILLGTFVLSAGFYDAYFEKAQKIRKKLIHQTDLIFKDFDAVILPVSPETAPKMGEKSIDPITMYLTDIYTVYANLTGLPAISLPLFTHPNNLPFGLQIMTNRFQELSLFQISHQLMHQ